MKKFLFFIILIVSLQAYSQTGGSWSGILNTGVPASQIEEMDLLANRTGLHLVVKNTNNGIIYYRLNTNGSIQQTYNFPNSVGANFPRITGDHNNLYVLYQKEDLIKAFYSSNGGTNWSSGDNPYNIDIKDYTLPPTLSNVSSLECAFDIYPNNIRRVHITFTAKENNVNLPFYQRYYTEFPSYSWAGSAIGNATIGTNPTVTVMPSAFKTFVSFNVHNPPTVYNSSFTFEYIGSGQPSIVWNSSYEAAAENSLAEKVFVDSPYLHLFFFDLQSKLCHKRSNSMRTDLGGDPFTWGGRPSNLLKQNAALYKPRISTTADGFINIIYTASGLFYRRYNIVGDNDNWSSEFTITDNYVENLPCMSSVSNDIYFVWKDGMPLGGIKYLKLRKYDSAPLTPKNLAVTRSANNHPLLSWIANIEPDLKVYKIYKKVTEESGWQYLDTTSSTSFEDLMEQMVTGPPTANERVVSYRITAVDKGSLESSPSNHSSVRVYGPPMEKRGITNYEYELLTNYPNPFNPNTVIEYSLPKSSNVSLKIYDVLGREVVSLVNNEVQTAGVHKYFFNASGLSSGIYLYKITADGFTSSKKMLLIK